jgi:hypothetical protein
MLRRDTKSKQTINPKKYISLKHKNIEVQAEQKMSVTFMNKTSLKSTILWDVTQWSPVEFNRRFRGTLLLYSVSKSKPSK